jgi:hypothetical protein
MSSGGSQVADRQLYTIQLVQFGFHVMTSDKSSLFTVRLPGSATP